MSCTDCETDFGSESVSVIKMVNENGNENGIGTPEIHEIERK